MGKGLREPVQGAHSPDLESSVGGDGQFDSRSCCGHSPGQVWVVNKMLPPGSGQGPEQRCRHAP